jgi:hypothetical protein
MDTMVAHTIVSKAMTVVPEKSFAEKVCLPFLRYSQNENGGWGFRQHAESRVEPTCWALQALSGSALPEDVSAVASGRRFLHKAQLAEGSWTSAPGQHTGCWVTALACLTLLGDANSEIRVAAGLKWLCNDWPRDSTPWRRLLERLSSNRNISPVSRALRGWGWTPRTSSWVEPTAFALLALQNSPRKLLPARAERRRLLGEAMLYDRMCPGGGWNCGNPMVYGVAGEPLVVPTSLALLALRAYPQQTENIMSLDWLASSVKTAESAASLALAKICLEAYGRICPAARTSIEEIHGKGEFLGSVPVAAWVYLAHSEGQNRIFGKSIFGKSAERSLHA